MYNKELTLFSVFHKAYPVPDCDLIKPIQVGKALTTVDLGFLKDDTGDNISGKNPSFCELTALYRIWKDLDQIDSDFVGLAHYRRYFVLPEVETHKGLFSKKNVKSSADCYIEELTPAGLQKVCAPAFITELLNALRSGKLIVPAPAKLYIGDAPANTRDFYIYYHIREDWLFLEHIIKDLFPEYNAALTQFSAAQDMHCYNMFIGDKAFISGYCTWLFAVLAELEKVIKICDYPYQRRVFGFLAERLLNIYILKHKPDTATFPVIFFKD